MPESRNSERVKLERSDLKEDNQAQLDELGDESELAESAGQSGDSQELSHVEEASEESVEELSNTDQAMEANAVQGIEDAANHPEKPVRAHTDFPREDNVPPVDGSRDDAA